MLIVGRNFYVQLFVGIKSKKKMKLRKLQEDKEIITQQDDC